MGRRESGEGEAAEEEEVGRVGSERTVGLERAGRGEGEAEAEVELGDDHTLEAVGLSVRSNSDSR